MKIRSTRRQSVKPLALVGIFVIAVAIAFLFAPIPQPSEWRALCVQVYPISPRMNLVINCDSHGFVRLARDPEKLLRPRAQWQSRPGYVALGWIAAQPAGVVSEIVRMRTGKSNSRIDNYYFGFILINGVILVGSTMLFLRIVGATSPFQSWAVLPVAMLLVNIVTKPFFWTPHQQLFNVFIPLLSILLYSLVTRRWRSAPIWRYALAGFLLGMASLVYGAFVLCAAATAAAMLFTVTTKTRVLSVLRIVVLAATFALPPFAWREYVKHETGSFYMLETDYYNEFIWMGQAIAKGWAATETAFSFSLRMFLATLPDVAVVPMVLLVIAALVVARLAHEPPLFLRSDAVKGAACFLVVALPFYALMGFYAERLSWVLTVPLLVMLAFMLREIFERVAGLRRRIFNVALVALALIYAAYTVATPGPYS